jgi:hypothetical protein
MGLFSKRRYDPTDSEYEGGGATWSTRCEKDPRFNLSGSCLGVSSSVFHIDAAIRAKQKELGLSDEYMKSITIEMSVSKS